MRDDFIVYKFIQFSKIKSALSFQTKSAAYAADILT
ncbi:MAG: hypothetical protein KatS3mg093_279 [Candidatus Parcubacteria bacterium]|nr:MAG: hypothetical protein KatS3mg093_279 [Candidatus Parcubacteria bacterium]